MAIGLYISFATSICETKSSLRTSNLSVFWVEFFDRFGRFFGRQTIQCDRVSVPKSDDEFDGKQKQEMMVEMIFRGELAVLRWGNTHPSNVRETHTHKQLPTKNLESRVILLHEKPGKSKSDHFHPRKTQKRQLNLCSSSDFLHDGICQFLGRGVRSHPQKSSKQPNNQVVAFLKCFIHLEISCIWKKQQKHITSTSHTVTPRSLGQKRCLNLSERWIAADASALRESPDPSLPGSWISSLACFSSFQEWSITHF